MIEIAKYTRDHSRYGILAHESWENDGERIYKKQIYKNDKGVTKIHVVSYDGGQTWEQLSFDFSPRHPRTVYLTHRGGLWE